MSNEDIDAAIQLGIEQERNRILNIIYDALDRAYGDMGAVCFLENVVSGILKENA